MNRWILLLSLSLFISALSAYTAVTLIPSAKSALANASAGGPNASLCSSARWMENPTSEIIPALSPNRIMPAGLIFQSAAWSAESIWYIKAVDSLSTQTHKSYGVPENCLMAAVTRLCCSSMRLRGVLNLANSRLALAASAIAPATCAWAYAAPAFALAMSNLNPSAFAFASAACCSAIAVPSWAFAARSSAFPARSDASPAASFDLAIFSSLSLESNSAWRSLAAIKSDWTSANSLPFRMILHCEKKTAKATNKAAKPHQIYEVFEESTTFVSRSASEVRRRISETFPGSLIWGFIVIVITFIVAFISAWRTTRWIKITAVRAAILQEFQDAQTA